MVRVGRAVLVALDPVGTGLMDLADPAALVKTDLASRVDLTVPVVRAVLRLVVLVDMGLAALVKTDLVGLAALVKTDPVVLVDMGLAALVKMDPVVLVDMGLAALVQTDLVGLAAPVVLDLMDLAGRVVPVDRLRRRMCNTASTTAVAPSGVAPTTLRTGSAHRTTERRPRRGNTDSAGTAGLPPGRPHPTGTGHRLLAAGTVRRLPAVGTRGGMDRHATSVWRSAISDRSPTTATTPSRSSIHFSADGVSGSSAFGFRCTDLTAPSHD